MSWQGDRKDDALYTLIMEINEDRYRVYDRGGYRIWLNVSESRQMAKRAAGLYEPEKFAAIATVLREGSTFLDIGGNKGDFALFAASVVGPSGHVVCFEPHPDNAAWIRKSLALNRFEHLSVEEMALSDTAGEAELHIGGKSGQHSFEPRKRDRGAVKVRATRLDDYVKSRDIERIDAIKIDVEGAEDQVIAGAMEMLEQSRPVIFLDVHDIGAARLTDLAGKLHALGYRFRELESDAVTDRLVADRDYVMTAELPGRHREE